MFFFVCRRIRDLPSDIGVGEMSGRKKSDFPISWVGIFNEANPDQTLVAKNENFKAFEVRACHKNILDGSDQLLSSLSLSALTLSSAVLSINLKYWIFLGAADADAADRARGRKSNPGPLGVKRERYPCAMRRQWKLSFITQWRRVDSCVRFCLSLPY